MIILHNPYDKKSRDFIGIYGKDNQVLNYPDCLIEYPTVSSFPSVVITVPAYYQVETVIETGEIGSEDYDKTVIPGANNPEYIHLYSPTTDDFTPDSFWNEVQNYIDIINQRAKDNPPKHEE